MAPLMREVGDAQDALSVPFDHRRPLIVGVIPHTYCNPTLTGCGFCTFPHEKYRGDDARRIAGVVNGEITLSTQRHPQLGTRRVGAVYFGGGTANLTPVPAFRSLCEALRTTFDLTHAEVTLEGVPIYFLAKQHALLDALQGDLPARQARISMGVQTFDPNWLERMGRSKFGTRQDIAKVAQIAHDRGITTSADLLINLPGQKLEAMLDDVRIAAAMGFDQVCLYHLVMYPGLGTAWSTDARLLELRPSNESACTNWLALREVLLEDGFVQTTLTNFERLEVNQSPRRFEYERMSYALESYDAIGFGPAGISFFLDPATKRAVKWINATTAVDYAELVSRRGRAERRSFTYDETDLRLLFLTRRLATAGMLRADYRALFDTDPIDDFGEEWALAHEASLVHIDEQSVSLTARGMFYADSVAGLLAQRKAAALASPGTEQENRSERHYMG